MEPHRKNEHKDVQQYILTAESQPLYEENNVPIIKLGMYVDREFYLPTFVHYIKLRVEYYFAIEFESIPT